MEAENMNNNSNPTSLINIRKLLQVLTILAHQSCYIIKQSSQNKQLKKFYKSGYQIATQADLKIQTLIIKGIKTIYPEINIIGQENQDYKGDIQFDFKELPKKQFFNEEIYLKQQLPEQDLTIWIDPIDATSSFVKGNLHFATILIGITYKSKAHAGVIGSAFVQQHQNQVFKPSVIFGSSGVQQCYEFCGIKKQFKRMKKYSYQKGQQINVAIQRVGKSNKGHPYEDIIKQMNANQIWARGVGKKGCMLAKGQTYLYIFRQSWLSMWDICAPEAIIKSLGGYLLALDRKEMIYDRKSQTFNIQNGFVASLHQNIFQKGFQIIQKCKN